MGDLILSDFFHLARYHTASLIARAPVGEDEAKWRADRPLRALDYSTWKLDRGGYSPPQPAKALN